MQLARRVVRGPGREFEGALRTVEVVGRDGAGLRELSEFRVAECTFRYAVNLAIPGLRRARHQLRFALDANRRRDTVLLAPVVRLGGRPGQRRVRRERPTGAVPRVPDRRDQREYDECGNRAENAGEYSAKRPGFVRV